MNTVVNVPILTVGEGGLPGKHLGTGELIAPGIVLLTLTEGQPAPSLPLLAQLPTSDGRPTQVVEVIPAADGSARVALKLAGAAGIKAPETSSRTAGLDRAESASSWICRIFPQLCRR
ncbi:hypothetical protein [Ornithinimicrobium sp. Y1694]|uniref:hypothetical protein n=1 Tax=Ornithinimicrobium sp. Y1694 TaxID=3418590 RepID=UPI003CF17DD4